ncbi:CAP-Gly domain-containing linker protein 1 [Biomphalaria glabrata]|nr:CAP-Gly domain-containing linker protein 1 [Biomphalaria glabrata]
MMFIEGFFFLTGYRVPDNIEMQKKLKEAQDQIKSLDILLNGANKQKDIFEKNYKVLEQKLSSGEKNLKELESEKNKLNKAISELQKENTDLESKRASAEHESHAISAQLEKEKNIVKNLQKECLSLQSYVCKLQNEVKELESEKIKLAKIISKLENTKANLEKDRDAISSCLNEEKERYKKECATLMSTITQLQREGKIYDEENNKMDRTIQELVTMNASLEKNKDIIATQLEAERDKSQKELKSSISVLLEESEAEKVKLSSRITELQKETLELGKKLENTEQEFQSVSSQLLEEKSSVSTIKEKCSAMNFTILTMENEIADLKTEKINLVQGLSELENVRASLEKDKNGLSSCIEEEREKSKKECSVFMSLITELKQEREQFHPEVVQFKITIDELDKQNASLENDKKAISSQWEFERDKSQIALKESEAEKEKLNAMISEVQKVSLELEKKLEDSVQKCQAICSELKEEKISVSTFKEEYSLMKLAVSSMETELADLKAERTTLVQTMSELENARICLSSRLDEERGMSKKDLSILMSSVVELKNDIEYFQVEKKSFK